MEKFAPVLTFVGNRLRERSTYAGAVVLLSAVFHVSLSDGVVQAVTDFGIALGGLLALLPDSKATSTDTPAA